MSRSGLAPLALVALLVTLAACASRPGAVGIPSPPTSPVETPTAEAAATVELIGHIRGESQAPFVAMLERASSPDTAIHYEGAEQVPELLRSRVEADRIPSIVILPRPDWLVELAEAGVARPLAPAAARAVEEGYGPTWRDLVSVDGTIYGLPLDANAKSLLWFDPGSLAGLSGSPAESLDGLERLADELARDGRAAFAVPGGAGWPLTDWFENVLLAEAGAERYEALVRREIAWDDPAIERAARRYAALLAPEHVMGGTSGATRTALRPESFRDAFDGTPPDAALWLGAGSGVERLIAGSGLEPDRFGTARFPAGDGIVGIGSVAVALDDRPETMALLARLATVEVIEPWIASGGTISPHLGVPLESYPSERARVEARLLREASGFNYDLSDRLPPELGGEFLYEQLRDMLRRPERIPELLAEIEAVATRVQGSTRDARP